MSLQRFLTRVIWWCLLPLVVLAGALAVDYLLTRRTEQEHHAEEVARGVALAVDDWLQSREGALLMLAQSSDVDRPARHAALYLQARAFHDYFGGPVVLADALGTMVFNTRVPFGEPLPPVPRPSGRSAVDAAIATGRPAVSDLFEGALTKSPMLALAVPVRREGRPPLLLIHALEPRQLAGLLDAQPLPPAHQLRLLDSTGAVIARRGAAESAGPGAVYQHTVETRAAPWRVELAIPYTEHSGPLWRAAGALAATLFGTALAGMLGGAWAGRRLTRDVHALVEGPVAKAETSGIAEFAAAGQRLQRSMAERQAAEAARRESDLQARLEIEQASLALQVREAQLRGIFDSASDAIITIDDAQSIVMANPAAALMFGIALPSLMGSPLSALLPARFRETHAGHVREFGEAGISARHMGRGAPLRALRANGDEFPIDAAISRVHIDGQRLFTVILRDVTEHEKTLRELHGSRVELQASHAALQRLVVAQDRIQEGERRRIARELHDDLQQTLAAIVIEVAALRGELHASGAGAFLNRIDGLAASAIDSTRRIVHDLRPQTLEELGLVPALKALAAGFARQTGIACEVEVADALKRQPSPPDAIATCLYRVAQEALNNVAKHSQARQVQMSLAEREGGGLVLRISDDGRGIRPDDRAKPESFGLVGMRERVLAIGGSLNVGSEPGKGTRLQVEVPR